MKRRLFLLAAVISGPAAFLACSGNDDETVRTVYVYVEAGATTADATVTTTSGIDSGASDAATSDGALADSDGSDDASSIDAAASCAIGAPFSVDGGPPSLPALTKLSITDADGGTLPVTSFGPANAQGFVFALSSPYTMTGDSMVPGPALYALPIGGGPSTVFAQASGGSVITAVTTRASDGMVFWASYDPVVDAGTTSYYETTIHACPAAATCVAATIVTVGGFEVSPTQLAVTGDHVFYSDDKFNFYDCNLTGVLQCDRVFTSATNLVAASSGETVYGVNKDGYIVIASVVEGHLSYAQLSDATNLGFVSVVQSGNYLYGAQNQDDTPGEVLRTYHLVNGALGESIETPAVDGYGPLTSNGSSAFYTGNTGGIFAQQNPPCLGKVALFSGVLPNQLAVSGTTLDFIDDHGNVELLPLPTGLQ